MFDDILVAVAVEVCLSSLVKKKKSRAWVPELVMTSCQEALNPSSSIIATVVSVTDSNGEELNSFEQKQPEVGEAPWSSSNLSQNRKLRDAPEVKSIVANLSLRGQFHWELSKE